MLKQIFCEFTLATVKFFGWTTGIILAIYFWDDPVRTTFMLKEMAHGVLTITITLLILIYLVTQTTKKKEMGSTTVK